MQPNECKFKGRLVDDSSFKIGNNGNEICKFKIACNSHYIDKKTQEVKESVVYVMIYAFGPLANDCQQLKKGELVFVNSRYQVSHNKDKNEYFHSFKAHEVLRVKHLKSLKNETSKLSEASDKLSSSINNSDIPF